MSSERIALRHAAVSVLKAALPELSGRVHANRVVSFEGWELPAVTVFTSGEEVEIEERGPRTYRRKVELNILVATSELGAIDDTLDGFEERIVQAIEQSDDLNQTAAYLALTAVRGPAIDADGRTLIAHTTLVYEATYLYDAPRVHPAAEHALREVGIQIDVAARTGPEIEGRALPEQE